MVSFKVRHRQKVLYTAVQMIGGDYGYESQELVAIKKIVAKSVGLRL